MTDELKSCPFCGEVPVDVYESIAPSARPTYFSVECPNKKCPCEGAVSCGKTEEEAINKWNTRHTPDLWQRIETAPKDGTRILVATPHKAKKNVCIVAIARWIQCKPDTPLQMNKERTRLALNHGGYFSAHFKGVQPLQQKPTHWMPVPQPPKGE